MKEIQNECTIFKLRLKTKLRMKDIEEWVGFERTYKTILNTVLNNKIGVEVNQHLIELFKYNVNKGKRFRGLLVVKAFKELNKDFNENIDENELELSRILGWIVEILQAFALVIDDVMDQSITRRGQLCWYKKENVGLNAINDGLILEQECYRIIREFFSDKSYYSKIFDLCHEMSRYTTLGQYMDMASNPPNSRPQFHLFNRSRYETIVKYKTSYYSFVGPVRLAMYMNSIDSESEHNLVENILLKIGLLFQIQDDYLDCFGDPLVTGKVGTDIGDGKCSWNVITAMDLCNQNQLNVLKHNYGLKDQNCVKRVEDLYRELNLIDFFRKEEEMLYKDICSQIDAVVDKSGLNSQIFKSVLNKIYKREK